MTCGRCRVEAQQVGGTAASEIIGRSGRGGSSPEHVESEQVRSAAGIVPASCRSTVARKAAAATTSGGSAVEQIPLQQVAGLLPLQLLHLLQIFQGVLQRLLPPRKLGIALHLLRLQLGHLPRPRVRVVAESRLHALDLLSSLRLVLLQLDLGGFDHVLQRVGGAHHHLAASPGGVGGVAPAEAVRGAPPRQIGSGLFESLLILPLLLLLDPFLLRHFLL
mmetsp:Transcript_30115/g.63918  ORF Transcript_30115/g.63918 Transcript_30115/m.63918 type:complete len:220 (-) Transcript_30115:241-900(-)